MWTYTHGVVTSFRCYSSNESSSIGLKNASHLLCVVITNRPNMMMIYYNTVNLKCWWLWIRVGVDCIGILANPICSVWFQFKSTQVNYVFKSNPTKIDQFWVSLDLDPIQVGLYYFYYFFVEFRQIFKFETTWKPQLFLTYIRNYFLKNNV